MPFTAKKKASAPPAKRAPRPDGAATRLHLLETAGQVFAERGYADATSKEICERAGTPMASVNYHFGSREALYEEVLVEAHRQIVSVDELVEMTRSLGDPRQKLRALLAHMLAPSSREAAPWGFRVVLREVMSPGPLAPALVEKAVRPKAKLLLGLIAEILALPPDHPAVQRALVFSVLPCIVLLVAPKEIPRKVLPAIAKDSAGLFEDLMRYMLAGLDALAREHRAPAPSSARKATTGSAARESR
ncbi:TetR/AcrR family transcriptional regulator [Variovorax paradoxus]|nr:TetR/AcrR family transcriptional regulator [Variovorax paradoxus]